MSEFGGLLRGIVVDNNDPKKLGRIKVRVQAAYGDQPVDNLPWAWPCLNYGGMPGMHNYAVPEVGAGVWVMFQNKDGQPDTTYPVGLVCGRLRRRSHSAPTKRLVRILQTLITTRNSERQADIQRYTATSTDSKQDRPELVRPHGDNPYGLKCI